MSKVAVVYYSMYGHVAKMADEIVVGLKEAGVQADLFQIAETLPQEVLDKMHAPPKRENVPVATPDTLLGYDGFLFGIPTRYGTWPAQWKTFLDKSGQIWQTGGWHGKYAGLFFSTASQGGGQETTAFTALTTLTHHGINFVPLGYAKSFGELTQLAEVSGGSPYGSGTIAGGDGSRQPSDLEKKLARIQGKSFGETIKKVSK